MLGELTVDVGAGLSQKQRFSMGDHTSATLTLNTTGVRPQPPCLSPMLPSDTNLKFAVISRTNNLKHNDVATTVWT